MYGCSVGRWKRGLYLILGDTGALRRWSTVTELCKGTPGVASARPVITSCDIDVVVRFYYTLGCDDCGHLDGLLSYLTFLFIH